MFDISAYCEKKLYAKIIVFFSLYLYSLPLTFLSFKFGEIFILFLNWWSEIIPLAKKQFVYLKISSKCFYFLNGYSWLNFHLKSDCFWRICVCFIVLFLEFEVATWTGFPELLHYHFSTFNPLSVELSLFKQIIII